MAKTRKSPIFLITIKLTIIIIIIIIIIMDTFEKFHVVEEDSACANYLNILL
jgi:hypothetical protein